MLKINAKSRNRPIKVDSTSVRQTTRDQVQDFKVMKSDKL